jgi:hypothetical protein
MEPVSAITSIFAIYNQLEQCGKCLYRFKRDFRIAKQEVNLLIAEIFGSKILFGIFDQISSELDNKVMRLAREHDLVTTLHSQATSALEQIEDITRKVQPLKKGNSPGLFDLFLAKLRWHLTKTEVQPALITLSSVKISLIALTSLLSLNHVIEKLNTSIRSEEKQCLFQRM